MIEVLAEDAVAVVGGGDGDPGLNIIDWIKVIKDGLKDPRIDGSSPDEFSPI